MKKKNLTGNNFHDNLFIASFERSRLGHHNHFERYSVKLPTLKATGILIDVGGGQIIIDTPYVFGNVEYRDCEVVGINHFKNKELFLTLTHFGDNEGYYHLALEALHQWLLFEACGVNQNMVIELDQYSLRSVYGAALDVSEFTDKPQTLLNDIPLVDIDIKKKHYAICFGYKEYLVIDEDGTIMKTLDLENEVKLTLYSNEVSIHKKSNQGRL
ncbi:hypothetical protein [Vibrio harveyi]|uniref:hypothetical protein n=1 Tax=Vibrio harveyi TaxID=669 RepID=UPI0023800BE6|nr:hypothetical protein [Vibrio harveyi]